jgi:hypothetical protein
MGGCIFVSSPDPLSNGSRQSDAAGIVTLSDLVRLQFAHGSNKLAKGDNTGIGVIGSTSG